MALQCASSSTIETHHKPTNTKRWINALVFQKTLLPLQCYWKKCPIIQQTWWRKCGENPQKTQGVKCTCFPEKTATAALIWKNALLSSHTMEKTWRKTHKKPKKQHALVFQKTLLPLLRFEKTPSYPATQWRKCGENPQKKQGATRPWPQANLARRHLGLVQVHSNHKQRSSQAPSKKGLEDWWTTQAKILNKTYPNILDI